MLCSINVATPTPTLVRTIALALRRLEMACVMILAGIRVAAATLELGRHLGDVDGCSLQVAIQRPEIGKHTAGCDATCVVFIAVLRCNVASEMESISEPFATLTATFE